MTPKWIYYAAANFGVVGMTLLAPLFFGPLPTALRVVLLIVCLIAANLAAWLIQRARTRLALATDQPALNRKLKMKPIQLVLIGLGLALVAYTMFIIPSSDQPDRIWGMIAGLLTLSSGIVVGIKRKPKPNA